MNYGLYEKNGRTDPVASGGVYSVHRSSSSLGLPIRPSTHPSLRTLSPTGWMDGWWCTRLRCNTIHNESTRIMLLWTDPPLCPPVVLGRLQDVSTDQDQDASSRPSTVVLVLAHGGLLGRATPPR